MIDLKPCPACGGTDVRVAGSQMQYVTCSNGQCHLDGPIRDPDGTKWNALPRSGAAQIDDGPLDVTAAEWECAARDYYNKLADARMRIVDLEKSLMLAPQAYGAEGEPPMSRERFRQEAVLRIWGDHEAMEWSIQTLIKIADQLTAAVFGEGVG